MNPLLSSVAVGPQPNQPRASNREASAAAAKDARRSIRRAPICAGRYPGAASPPSRRCVARRAPELTRRRRQRPRTAQRARRVADRLQARPGARCCGRARSAPESTRAQSAASTARSPQKTSAVGYISTSPSDRKLKNGRSSISSASSAVLGARERQRAQEGAVAPAQRLGRGAALDLLERERIDRRGLRAVGRTREEARQRQADPAAAELRRNVCQRRASSGASASQRAGSSGRSSACRAESVAGGSATQGSGDRSRPRAIGSRRARAQRRR